MTTTENEDYKFTHECRNVLVHMKDNIVQMYPVRKIRGEHYLLAIGDIKDCEAYKILSGLMLSENMEELFAWCSESINKRTEPPTTSVKYDSVFNKCLEDASKDKSPISSGSFLYHIVMNSQNIAHKLLSLGVTAKQIQHELSDENDEKPQQQAKNEQKNENANSPQQPKKNTPKSARGNKNTTRLTAEAVELDKYMVNISTMAEEGKVDEVVGNEDVINSVFTCLLKREKNNALLVGDVGSGRTSTVMHIANLINEGNVAKHFEDKRLMLMDFMSLVSGTGFRGGFEAKYETVVENARKLGNVIVFIDDIHSILWQNSKFSEVSTDIMLDKLLSDKRIPCICVTTYEGYSKTIMTNELLNSRFEKIEMPKRNKQETIEILCRVKEKYENFHDVIISKEFVTKAVDACERFLPDYCISTVSEIMDMAASIERMSEKPDDELLQLKTELQEIEDKISTANTDTDASQYDNLMKEKVAKKTEISQKEKELNLSRKKPKLTDKQLLEAISKKTGLPTGELTKDDTEKLSKLPKRLKEWVIGQDEAIDTVCAAVRRQRSGLSDRNKPQVFLFVGRTGCGKTYLAKKLSEAIYGSERNMVRLDMSEYSDKISVNKLTGASSGYVGYDDGGVLTEAVKKNKHCIVLLDEIEKADDGVFDVFLQVFDEGRLTDNKGVTVDFSDTIIIMTSNIGMKEIEDRGIQVGFTRDTNNSYDKDVVLKTLKRRFKPEFLNRINDIVFFNSLTDDNIKAIITSELKKVEKRVEKAGYSLSNDVYTGNTAQRIFDEVRNEKEYGARPVIRTIERLVEDKIADLIIEGGVKKGHTFVDEEITKEY